MLTTKQAAKQLNVCTAAVRNYIRSGVGKEKEKLKAILIKHGLRPEYRIKQSDLEKFKKKYLI